MAGSRSSSRSSHSSSGRRKRRAAGVAAVATPMNSPVATNPMLVPRRRSSELDEAPTPVNSPVVASNRIAIPMASGAATSGRPAAADDAAPTPQNTPQVSEMPSIALGLGHTDRALLATLSAMQHGAESGGGSAGAGAGSGGARGGGGGGRSSGGARARRASLSSSDSPDKTPSLTGSSMRRASAGGDASAPDTPLLSTSPTATTLKIAASQLAPEPATPVNSMANSAPVTARRPPRRDTRARVAEADAILGAIALEREAAITEGDVVFQDLQLGRTLGDGCFGRTYEAEYRGRKVAAKEVKEDAHKQFLESAVSTLRTVHGANIVQFIGIARSASALYLVTELLPTSLYALLHDPAYDRYETSLTWTDRGRILHGVAKGLVVLHNNKLTHRNLHAANVLLSEDHRTAKLNDFAVPHPSAGNPVIERVQWAAPEVLLGGPSTWQADIFAFGVLTAQVMTGSRVVRHAGTHSVDLDKLRASVHDGCPPVLIDLAVDCLSDTPKKRPVAAQCVIRLNDLVLQLSPPASGKHGPRKSSAFSFGSAAASYDSGYQARRPVWVPDFMADQCKQCGSEFTFFNRRHHCRHCGDVFDHACSSNKVAIPMMAYPNPVRVCDACHQLAPFSLDGDA